MKGARGRDDCGREEGGIEKDVGKERKPEYICSAAEGTALLQHDPGHDGEAIEHQLGLGFR